MLNPERDGQKYMNLAEMLSGAEAVQMQRKGISVMKNDMERYRQAGNQVQEQHLLK